MHMIYVFAYNPQINFCHFFHEMNQVIFLQSEYILDILCIHHLLQFYADSFETLQMCRSWSEDLYFLTFFSK